ncbi:MAG: hypothetical protein RIS35_1447 [Pseudomonadota bacterium]|jgi:alkylation response protein AidB-like acyl-CoA dehydrogenase
MFELVQESLSRILDDHAAAAGANPESPEGARRLISVIEEAGMLDVLAGWDGEAPPVAWRDAADLFMLLGNKCPDGPIAEAILARALVSAAGGTPVASLAVAAGSSGSLKVEQTSDGPVLSGSVQVPWSAIASAVVVPVRVDTGWRIAVVERAQVRVATVDGPGRDSRGEPRGPWMLETVRPLQWLEWRANDDARLPGAAMRAAQIAGAMKAALALSMQYANDRVQFARPISKNQAIQHNLALMAEHAALTGSGARLAWAGDGLCGSIWRVASAKGLASDLAGEVAAIAHAVHGAIGFTSDYALHRITRRLWQWRSEDGGAATWHAVVGEQAAAHAVRRTDPTEGLWGRIVQETSTN